MSYFLLKSRRNKPHPPCAVPGLQNGRKSHHNSAPRVDGSKPAAVARAVPTGDGQMQIQQQVQRPKINVMRCKPSQQQQQKRQQRSQQKSKQEQVQGVISMEEVMQDLRVLEQQQVDSQRKLATIKLTKQHRIEQQVLLENKLAKVKYANGEHRARLLRSRDVLSKNTRELGKARLYGGRCSIDLKVFDGRLKKALALARRLRGMRRIIDGSIFHFRMKQATLQQVKAKAKENAKQAEIKRDEAQHRKKLIHKSIQNHAVGAKQLEEKSHKIRSEVTGLEQDLAAARQMEASTKLRAESIAVEISTESSRNRTSLIQLNKKLDESRKKKCNVLAKTELLKGRVGTLKKERVQSWQRGVKFAEEEGHNLPPAMKDNHPMPFVDITKMRLIVKEEEGGLAEESKINSSLEVGIKQVAAEEARLVAKELEMRGQSEALKNSAIESIVIQERRLQQIEHFLTILEKDREKVRLLRQSRSELEISLRDLDTKAAQSLSKKTQFYQEKFTLVTEIKARLLEMTKDKDEAIVDWEQQQNDDKAAIDVAKKKAEAVKSKFEQTRLESENISTDLDARVLAAVQNLQQVRIDLSHGLKQDIAVLKKNYEFLSDLKICTKSDKTKEERRQEALADFQAACKSSIEDARNDREKRLQALVFKRNERIRLEREAALQKGREEERLRAERLKNQKEEKRHEEQSQNLNADVEKNEELAAELEKEKDYEAKRMVKAKRKAGRKLSTGNELSTRKLTKAQKRRDTTKRRRFELRSVAETNDDRDAVSYTKRAYGSRRETSRKTSINLEKTPKSRKNTSPRSSGSKRVVRFDSMLDTDSSYVEIETGAEVSLPGSQPRRVRCGNSNEIPSDGGVQLDIEISSNIENSIEETDVLSNKVTTPAQPSEDMVPFTQPAFPLSQMDSETTDDPLRMQDLEPKLKKDTKATKSFRDDANKSRGRVNTHLNHDEIKKSRKLRGSHQQQSSRSAKAPRMKVRKKDGVPMSKKCVTERTSGKSFSPKPISLGDKCDRGKTRERDSVSKHAGKLKKSTGRKDSSSQSSGISSMERSSKMSASALVKAGKSRRRKKGCHKTKSQGAGVGDDYSFHF